MNGKMHMYGLYVCIYIYIYTHTLNGILFIHENSSFFFSAKLYSILGIVMCCPQEQYHFCCLFSHGLERLLSWVIPSHSCLIWQGTQSIQADDLSVSSLRLVLKSLKILVGYSFDTRVHTAFLSS
jgi:hypothetical protein